MREALALRWRCARCGTRRRGARPAPRARRPAASMGVRSCSRAASRARSCCSRAAASCAAAACARDSRLDALAGVFELADLGLALAISAVERADAHVERRRLTRGRRRRSASRRRLALAALFDLGGEFVDARLRARRGRGRRRRGRLPAVRPAGAGGRAPRGGRRRRAGRRRWRGRRQRRRRRRSRPAGRARRRAWRRRPRGRGGRSDGRASMFSTTTVRPSSVSTSFRCLPSQRTRPEATPMMPRSLMRCSGRCSWKVSSAYIVARP